MSLRFYHKRDGGPIFAGQGGAARTGGSDLVENADEKELSKVETYLDRALRLLPGEAFFLFAVGMNLPAGPIGENFKITIVAILCLVATFILRVYALPEHSRPQKRVAFVTLLVCVLWIYSMGGYFISPVNQAYNQYCSFVLIFIGMIYPLYEKGDVVYIKDTSDQLDS